MARGYLSDNRSRKEQLVKYINQLMVAKGWNQSELAARCGKTQSWLSKKLDHCGFYVGELMEILKILGADQNEVGRIMVGK